VLAAAVAVAMASMERGMGSMRAAPEELRTKAEVRVRTVPKVDGWESAAHMKWLALREKEVEEVDEINDCFGVEASEFRDTWNRRYSSYCGFFEDTSKFFFALPNPWNLSLICNWYLDPTAVAGP
jgi:hypothetical protein